MCVKNTLNPIERKTSATCTREIIQVDINPKNAIHLKLVLIYRNTRIKQLTKNEFYTVLEEILLPQHECVAIGDFIFQTYNRDCRDQLPHQATN